MARKSSKAALAEAEQKAEALQAENDRLRDRLSALEASPAIDPTVRDHVRSLYESGDVEQAQALMRHLDGNPQAIQFEAYGPGDEPRPGGLRDQMRQQEIRKRAAILWFNEVGGRPGREPTPDWVRMDSDEPVPEEWASRVNPDMLETAVDDYDADGVLILDRKGARFTDGQSRRPRRARPEDEALVRRTVANLQAGSRIREPRRGDDE